MLCDNTIPHYNIFPKFTAASFVARSISPTLKAKELRNLLFGWRPATPWNWNANPPGEKPKRSMVPGPRSPTRRDLGCGGTKGRSRHGVWPLRGPNPVKIRVRLSKLLVFSEPDLGWFTPLPKFYRPVHQTAPPPAIDSRGNPCGSFRHVGIHGVSQDPSRRRKPHLIPE